MDVIRPTSFATVLGVLMLPFVLISFNTVLDTLMAAGVIEEGVTWAEYLKLLGNTSVALLITVIVAIVALGLRENSMADVGDIFDKALGPVCSIILITGAGGMFGGVLRLSGIGDALSGSLSKSRDIANPPGVPDLDVASGGAGFGKRHVDDDGWPACCVRRRRRTQ